MYTAMPLSKANFLIVLWALCFTNVSVQAFVAVGVNSRTGSSRLNNDSGGIEEIEFRIYPDGRVTEVVRGVKGKNCEEVTAGKLERLIIHPFLSILYVVAHNRILSCMYKKCNYQYNIRYQ